MSLAMKGKLSRLFTGLGLAAVSVFGTLQCANDEPGREGEPLTHGEREVAKIVTLAGYDPYSIRKHFSGEQDSYGAGSVVGTDITFYGPSQHYHSSDYSRDVRNQNHDHYSPFRAGLFVHLIFHTMQYQLGTLRNLPACPRYNAAGQPDSYAAYRYDLNTVTHFNQLCSEQQARMVENYVRRFLHPLPAYLDANNDGIPDSDLKLKNIVEAAIPNIYEKWQRWIASSPANDPFRSPSYAVNDDAFPKGTEPEPEELAVRICPVYENTLRR